MKMIAISRSLAEEHYVEHQTKAFYEALIAYITAGPCIALVVEGPHAIEIMRKMIGSTDPREAQSGTIRGDFAISLQYNTIHGSDSQAAADREIQLFFTPDEIFAYGGGVDAWRP
jgi:nucleoside-diphosphate kinase